MPGLEKNYDGPARRKTANKADVKMQGVGSGDPAGPTGKKVMPRREADENGTTKSVMQSAIGGLGYGNAESKMKKVSSLGL